jgi:NitT/TauT family transport system substrate-binding protein
MMPMNRTVLGAAFGAALLVVRPAVGAETVRYLNDWFPSGEEAYVYVGVQEGFFKDEGLDVTIGTAKGGSDAITRVATGGADFTGTGLAALMIAEAQGNIPVKAVMSVYTKQPDAIFTTKGSGITSLKDLAGDTLATATFSSSNPLWPVVAAASGLKPDSVTLLKVDFGALAPMLATGRVKATINWVSAGPGTEHVLQQAGKSLVVLPWSEFGLTGYSMSVMASDKIIKEHPDTVRHFVQAYAKAVAFMVKNPEKAAEDLHAMVPDADVPEAAAEIKAATPLIVNDISAKDGMGAFDPALVDKTWYWVAKSQDLPMDKIKPASVIDTAFVPEKH